MLDVRMDREGVPPKDAATLVLLRDGDKSRSLEVFCVERSPKSGFLAGAVVFPGGKLDESDRDPAWAAMCTPPRACAPGRAPLAPSDDLARALAITACRESLEEAAILPLTGPALGREELLALRARVDGGSETLRAFLAARGLRLDLEALHPFARWITPAAEARRFDTRFYATVVKDPSLGVHDDHETTRSFWGRPVDLLRRFDTGELQLAPPTHRTLEVLAAAGCAGEALDRIATHPLEPICPRLVRHVERDQETLALCLPGDAEHDVREPLSPGSSRYVLRGGRWLPGAPPEPSLSAPRGRP